VIKAHFSSLSFPFAVPGHLMHMIGGLRRRTEDYLFGAFLFHPPRSDLSSFLTRRLSFKHRIRPAFSCDSFTCPSEKPPFRPSPTLLSLAATTRRFSDSLRAVRYRIRTPKHQGTKIARHLIARVLAPPHHSQSPPRPLHRGAAGRIHRRKTGQPWVVFSFAHTIRMPFHVYTHLMPRLAGRARFCPSLRPGR